MAKLRVTFPVNLTPEEEALRMEVYWENLESFRIDLVSDAVNRALRENQFFPKVSQLRSLVMEEMDRHYLEDRKERWPEIEYHEPFVSRERAIEMIQEIRKRMEDPGIGPVLEGEAAEIFEAKRKVAINAARRFLLQG